MKIPSSATTNRALLDVRATLALVVAVLIGAVIGYAAVTAIGLRDTRIANTELASIAVPIGGLGLGIVAALLLLRRDGHAFLIRAPAPIVGWPGTRLGAGTLILAPLFLLAGEVTRWGHFYFYPDQLSAMVNAHTAILVSYSLYTAGLVLMIPAFLALAAMISRQCPVWGFWGGTIAVVGSAVRIFQEGISFLGLQLVDAQGLSTATAAVSDTYGAWYVLETLNGSDNLGWAILAVGAYRARVLGWMPALSVSFMMTHYSGVLKGTDLNSLTGAVLLAAALVPLGMQLWSGREVIPRGVRWLGIAGVFLLVLQYLAAILSGFRTLG